MRDSKATPLAHVQSVFHGNLTTFHFGGGRLAIKDVPKGGWLGRNKSKLT